MLLLLGSVVDNRALGLDEVGDEGHNEQDGENNVDAGGAEGGSGAAEGDADYAKVKVAEGGVLEAKDAQNGEQQGRRKGDEQDR